MTETVLKIKSVFDPKGAEEARSSFNKLKSALGGLNGIGSKSNGIFTNFFSSLTRIAKLRLLRGIIRSITGAFKEGIQNIYEYSRALGSADASHFASTMDSLASSMLYMKNSLGAVVAPLLTSLLPAIQTVVNWFVTATQVVAQFFAALGGQVMYTKAKEYATVWKDVGAATGGASAAAKEYKNTIMSFDEIHALNDTPSSGGGGGGGASAPDYGEMFEEDIISSKIQKFAKWLKENFEDILDIAKAIGAVLLGWKLADSVAGFFTALGFANGEAIRQLGLGIVLTVTGVTLSAKGGYDIGYEGVTLMNVIKTALGIGLAGAGGALTASAITSLGIASVGTGVGAVFGIALALVGTIIGISLGIDAKVRADAIAGLEEYKGQVQNILNSQNNFVQTSEAAWLKYDETIANLQYAKTLTKQLTELRQKEKLNNGEIELAKTLIDELNGLGLEGVRAEWNETTQQIEINTEEIYNNIDAMLEEARKAAYLEVYKEALKDQARQLVSVEQSQRLVEKAQNAYNEKLKSYQYIADATGRSLEDLSNDQYFVNTLMKEEKYALDEAIKALDTSNQKYNESSNAVADTAYALGYYTDDVYKAEKAKYTGSNVTGGMWNVYNSTNYAYWKINQLRTELGYLNGTTVHYSVSGTVHGGGGFSFANGGFVTGYANGGFVIPRFDNGGLHSAQIFMANENNNPELIGRIGNRTAVANQGQMVEAMAEGVYRAMSDVMNNGNSNVEVIVNMDSETVARAADRGNKSLNRRFSVSLA